MTCFYPLTVWRDRHGPASSGKHPLVFKPSEGIRETKMQVPCGQCVGCRVDRVKQWTMRCMHEAKCHAVSCFVTLTYGNDVPVTDTVLPTLRKRDLQLFMKRLRKRANISGIRYFAAGEYGDNYDRPHYHLCIFGYDFPDKKYWTTRDGSALYRSDLLEAIWPAGFSTVGELTPQSAAYVASYCQKKLTGRRSDIYLDRGPEFALMSRGQLGGIGKPFFDKYFNTIYQTDMVVERGGKMSKPPRYYDILYSRRYPAEMEVIKKQRIDKMQPKSRHQLDVELRLWKRKNSEREHLKFLKRSLQNGKSHDHCDL